MNKTDAEIKRAAYDYVVKHNQDSQKLVVCNPSDFALSIGESQNRVTACLKEGIDDGYFFGDGVQGFCLSIHEEARRVMRLDPAQLPRNSADYFKRALNEAIIFVRENATNLVNGDPIIYETYGNNKVRFAVITREGMLHHVDYDLTDVIANASYQGLANYIASTLIEAAKLTLREDMPKASERTSESLTVVGALEIAVDPNNTNNAAIRFVDPNIYSQVPNQHYHLVRGTYVGLDKIGKAVSYDYALHVYVNLKYEDEEIERVVTYFMKVHGGELSWKVIGNTSNK